MVVNFVRIMYPDLDLDPSNKTLTEFQDQYDKYMYTDNLPDDIQESWRARCLLFPKERPTQYQKFWTKINAVKLEIPDWQQEEDPDKQDISPSTTTTTTNQETIMQQQPDKKSSSTKMATMKEPEVTTTTRMDYPQPKISSKRPVDPDLIIDGNKSMPYEKFVKVLQRYFHKSKDPKRADHVALKVFNKILHNCKHLNLPLEDR